MRVGFWLIANGWQQDELIRLGERIDSAANWLRRNGGSTSVEVDELGTFNLMFKKQITLAVQAGAFEPVLSASLDDDAIQTILDDLDSSSACD